MEPEERPGAAIATLVVLPRCQVLAHLKVDHGLDGGEFLRMVCAVIMDNVVFMFHVISYESEYSAEKR